MAKAEELEGKPPKPPAEEVFGKPSLAEFRAALDSLKASEYSLEATIEEHWSASAAFKDERGVRYPKGRSGGHFP